MFKNTFKRTVRFLMERKVRRYFKKHQPTLVVVTGSVGKTSTKNAIATVLSQKLRVRNHYGNHNMDISVPPALMGIEYPEEVHSIKSWLTVLKAMNIRIKEPKDVDVIIQEIGTDRPGDVPYFAKYLKPDIAVVTAVSEEHMEFFGSLDEVAKEELSVASYSNFTVINRDDIEGRFAQYANTSNLSTYGLSEQAEYRLTVEPANPIDGRIGKIITPEWGELPVTVQLIGDHALKSVAAAACVGAKLGLSAEDVAVGISQVLPTAGRMQLLRGFKDSILVDDTYNSSPRAIAKALETLYAIEAPQRIAILGSMNELGPSSAVAHQQAGELCDPQKVEWVVTIGDDAQNYLAPAALGKGCQVKSFKTPYEAGGFVHGVMKEGAVVLVKGSQNKVFSEEALKMLLRDQSDRDKLVRQSESWMDLKKEQFSAFPSNEPEIATAS